MVLWKQDSSLNGYAKYSDNLKECRDYIFGQTTVPKPFRTYKGVPLITYTFKNGDMFKLPILEDFIDMYDYKVRSISFICRPRITIFGPHYT